MYIGTATMFLMISHFYAGNEDSLAIRAYINENPAFNTTSAFQNLVPELQEFLQSDGTLGQLKLDSLYEAFIYVFNLSIGNTADEISDLDTWGWILFLFSFIFFVVMLMNLLIAIVSEVFAETWPTREQNFYKELTDFLSVLALIDDTKDDKTKTDDDFLIVASPLAATNIIEAPQTEM